MSTNENIEFNEQKNRVRLSINEQVMSWAKVVPMKFLKTMTLPGEYGTFEHQLLEAAEKNGIKVEGDCFEFNPQRPHIFGQMKRHIPSVFTPYNMDICQGNGNDKNFVWLDFCGNFNKERIEKIVEILNNGGKAKLVYATFSLISRQYNTCAFANGIWEGEKDVAEAIVKRLNHEIAKHCENVHLIMDYRYKGGKRSNMLTIGFQKGKAKILEPIVINWLPKKEENPIEIIEKIQMDFEANEEEKSKSPLLEIMEFDSKVEKQLNPSKEVSDLESQIKQLKEQEQKLWNERWELVRKSNELKEAQGKEIIAKLESKEHPFLGVISKDHATKIMNKGTTRKRPPKNIIRELTIKLHEKELTNTEIHAIFQSSKVLNRIYNMKSVTRASIGKFIQWA